MMGSNHLFGHRKCLQAAIFVRRARLKKIVVCAFVATLIGAQKAGSSGKRLTKTGTRANVSFQGITRSLDDVTFAKAFRMPRFVFAKLLERIGPSLPLEQNRFTGINRNVIHADVRLSITIRLLAGASYLDIRMLWDISQTALYDIFHTCCAAIMTRMSLPGLPENVDHLMFMAQRFKLSRSPHSPLSGCVGALDGIAVKVKKPSHDHDPASFFCRKGYYSIPVQAMADADYRFLSFSALCKGSTHDSLAHNVSALGMFLRDQKLSSGFWIAGDEAYTCTESLITPVSSTVASEWEDAFNFHQSSLRMHIEQAFGLLMSKWRMLYHLNFSVQTSTRVICVAMKLHNFIREESGAISPRIIQRANMDAVQAEEADWYLHSVEEAGMESQFAKGSKSRCRQRMVQIVESKGLLRPPLPL